MRVFATLSLLAATAACTSTYVQEVESQNFRPVYADQPAYTAERTPTGGIYSASAQGLFVMDRRAAQVGDILPVELRERFSASKSQSASASSGSSRDMDLPNLFTGGFDDSLLTSSSDSSFQGRGAAQQSNSLTGRMTVSVVRILPGGLLEIMGEKRLTLNTGNEYIRLTGIVRAEDISADNVILSERIANAEIQYIGAGDVADTARPGWLNRGMNIVSPL